MRRLLLLALLPLWLAACDVGRGIEAAGLLIDLAGQPPGEEAVERRAVRFTVEGRGREGDLYLARDGPPKGALVLVPGAARAGRDDRRLVAFARRLAAGRFAVLVPEIPNVRELRVGPEDAEPIADAVRHLASAPAVPGEAVGLVAVSYATGPAFLAALEPDVQARVAFVLAIGGYRDALATVTFFTTGHYRGPGDSAWRRRQPNQYGKWVFVHANAPLLDDQGDRAILRAIADRKMQHLDAPIDDLRLRLTLDGRAVMALLDNRDPGLVPGLVEALPDVIRARIEGLDLARRDLSRFPAPVFLLHGREDDIIPTTESEALLRALPPGRGELFLVDDLAHAELKQVGLGDGLAFYRLIYRLLEERDRPAVDQAARSAGSSATPARWRPAM